MDVAVVGDVVPVVTQRRGIERQQPQRRHPELLEVAELLDETPEIADAVAVAVVEGADVQLVEDGVLVPACGLPDDGAPRHLHRARVGHAHGAPSAGSPACSGSYLRIASTCAGRVAGSRITKLRVPSQW